MKKFYFRGQSKLDKEWSGAIAAKWSDCAHWRRREIACAISDEGKRLLFIDELRCDEGKPVNTKSDVVVADLDVFDAQAGQIHLVFRHVHRRGYFCVELPRIIVSLGRGHLNFNIESFAFSTEGTELSPEDLRNIPVAAATERKFVGLHNCWLNARGDR